MKILIIDDDFSATTTLKALLLSREKFDIDVAYGGKEGVEKMRQANPSYDVLILDIMMPDFSGMDVCKAMSQDEKMKKTPVILASALPITSKELGEMVEEFKALSVIKGVIEKPFVIDDLLDQIHKISG